MAAAAIGNSVYACGGVIGDANSAKLVDTCGRLDVDSMTWHDMPKMPHGVNHAAYGSDGCRWEAHVPMGQV